MKKSYGKTVVVTAGITVVSLVCALLSFIVVMFAICPGRSGDFAYNIGYYDLASTLYHKEYTYSGNVSRLYQALYVAIDSDDYSKVIEYYEEFRDSKDYDKFINYKLDCAKTANVSTIVRAGLLNEKEFLERHYVEALLKKGKTSKAFNFAFGAFKADKVATLYKTGRYSLNYFTEKEYFNEVYLKEGMTLKEGIILYLDTLYEVFEANQYVNNSLDQAYLVSLGEKIVFVSQHLNSVLDTGDVRIETNNAYVASVNNILRSVLEN